jgi:hypothetical protein
MDKFFSPLLPDPLARKFGYSSKWNRNNGSLDHRCAHIASAGSPTVSNTVVPGVLRISRNYITTLLVRADQPALRRGVVFSLVAAIPTRH